MPPPEAECPRGPAVPAGGGDYSNAAIVDATDGRRFGLVVYTDAEWLALVDGPDAFAALPFGLVAAVVFLGPAGRSPSPAR